MSISAEAGQWAGSLRIGVTSLDVATALPANLAASITDMTSDTWFIAGSQVRRNNTILKLHFCPSLDWLLPGDRVGLLLSADLSLRLLVNSEDMGVAVTALPKVQHVYHELTLQIKQIIFILKIDTCLAHSYT